MLGPRRPSMQSVPECKALHAAVLQPALAHMRAGMTDQELRPFRVRRLADVCLCMPAD